MTPTPLQLAIMALESTPWRYRGDREHVIRTQLDLSWITYWQTVRRILTDPATRAVWHEIDPHTARRLSRHLVERTAS